MADELGELAELFDGIEKSVDELLRVDYAQITEDDVEAVAAEVLQKALISVGEVAIQSQQEYMSYAPLVDRFIQNLSDPAHIINEDGSLKPRPFDEDVAGTYDDFLQGWKRTGKPYADKFWKYGIYYPFEGKTSPTVKGKSKFKNIDVTYEDIVAQRLADWGDKAPYWYFIDNGNAGGRAYPNITPTHFVEKFRGMAARIVEQVRGIVTNAVETWLRNEADSSIYYNYTPSKGTTIKVATFRLRGLEVSMKMSSRGNIFYGIIGTGQNYIHPDKIMDEVARLAGG